MAVRLVCISDTHGLHDAIPAGSIPSGDILIHAGDLLGLGTLDEVASVNAWLSQLPHPHKVAIAGNHDAIFQTAPEWARAALPSVTYLQDSATQIMGLTFWGSPWTPEFMSWYFMLRPGEETAQWQKIPDDVDVVITHGPPHRLLDAVPQMGSESPINHVGCPVLRETIQNRVRPPLHVFGHIHEAYGQERLADTLYLNASTCTQRYHPTNPAVVIDMCWTDSGWMADAGQP